MSTMTKTVSSECSSLSDVDYDPITSIFAKLRAVISQEASLRKELDELFVKRTQDACIAVQNAQNHLELVKTQEVHMREILETESAAANEKPEELSIQEEQDGAAEEARRAEELAEEARTTLAYEAARKEAEELAEAEAKHIRDEEVAEKERQQEAAMIAAVEERRKVETEKLRLEQEASDQLAMLEEERLAELEMERLGKEEEDRLMAQEAAMIAAVEARHQAEAQQRLLEEERSAKQEADKIAAQKAAKQAMQEAAMIAAVEARYQAEARERQREEAEIAAWEEAERIKHEEEFAAELERICSERQAEGHRTRLEEVERLEQEQMEAEMRLAQDAQREIDDALKAQWWTKREQRLTDEEREREAREKAERERKAREKAEKEKKAQHKKNKIKRAKEEKERLEREKREEEENETSERLEEERLAILELQRFEAEEEREHQLYILLKGKTMEAEKSLDVANMRLAELEAQRNDILREVESARLEEASCRYHEATRSR